MKLNDYVIKNKQIITWLENKDHNSEFLGKYYGTLDYATARFHTILIKLSQDKIKEQKHEQDVAHCSKVINDFYHNKIRSIFTIHPTGNMFLSENETSFSSYEANVQTNLEVFL